MQHIEIVLMSEQLNPKSWAPAYRLTFIGRDYGGPRAKCYPVGTFATEDEANRQAEHAARQWCEDNHPGCPVTAVILSN
jgi:hypothetical protein